MRFASVCSGIGAPEVAWRPMWGEPVFVSEIEKFPSAVLAHHMPAVPNFGDFTRIANAGPEPDRPVDLLVGGTPCQAFSVAGKRAGLDDPRGNLTLEYLALARRLRPRWLVWENVPGVLSIDEGRTIGTFLGLLGQLGYRWAYRVLDAQYFGVPQRRRRVFVVGCLGDWQLAAAVLFEPESMRGDTPPRREAGQRPAPTISARPSGGGGLGTDFDCDGGLVAGSLQAKDGRGAHSQVQLVAHSLRGEGFDASEDGSGLGTPLVPAYAIQERAVSENLDNGPGGKGYQADTAYTLEARNKVQAVAFSCKDHGADAGEVAPTLRSMGHDGSHANAGGQVAVAFNGDDDASTYEADASSVLRTLREKVGAQAVAEWGSRILDSLQSPEVLRSWLHGESLRRQASRLKSFVDDCPLPREKGAAAATLRKVWEEGPDGRSPQGRGLAKQLAQQLGTALPQLPHARASRQPVASVRRLTPVECERLMGFPDDFTLIPWRGGMAPDGPRYKALGNSMAVPVLKWIGERIDIVDKIAHERRAA